MTNKDAQRQEPTTDQDTDQFDPYRYGKISFTTKFFRRLITTKLPEPNEEDMLDSIPPGAGPDADQVRRAGAEYVASHARGHATSSATNVGPDVAGNNTDATGVTAGAIAGATGATADATGALLGPTGSRVGATGGSADASLTGMEGASGSADAAGGSVHASDGGAHASDGGADARTVIIAELDPTKKKQFVLSPEEAQALRGGQRRRGVLWFVAVCALLGGLVMWMVVGNRSATSLGGAAASAAMEAERDGQTPDDFSSPGEPALGASAPPVRADRSPGVHAASASGDSSRGVHAANANGDGTLGVHPASPPGASAARADDTLSGGTSPVDTRPARAARGTSSTGTSASATKPSGTGPTRTNAAGPSPTRTNVAGPSPTRTNAAGPSPRASTATSSVGSETSSISSSSDFFDPRK